MDLNTIPLFSMLKDRLGYLSQRQKVIAQNVANADTPGYMAHDLKPFTLQMNAASGLAAVTPLQTSAMHMSGTIPANASGGFKNIDSPDSETTLDGNKVVLEEQMIKMTEARMDYDAAIGFYEKSLSLIRMAARAPGK
jgi:flagellar basal-body rod protein FlgB